MPSKKPLNSALKNILRQIERRKGDDYIEAWAKSVGEKALKHSRPARVQKGRLFVDVTDSSWLYELTLEKKKILEKLNKILESKKIKEIRFRIRQI